MRHPNTPSRPGSTVATRLKLFCALLVASVFSAAHAADLILPAPQSAGADHLDKRAMKAALTNVLRSRSVGLDFSALDMRAMLDAIGARSTRGTNSHLRRNLHRPGA